MLLAITLAIIGLSPLVVLLCMAWVWAKTEQSKFHEFGD